jgi:tol-pal system protein YbgF
MMKRRNLCLIASGVLALCLAAAPLRADSDSDNRALLERIVELEGQVKTLSQKTSGQGYAASAAGGPITNMGMDAPDVETRLSALETQLRNLTGQVEQATYQSQQANASMQKVSSDLDFRMQQLEQRQAAMAAPNPNVPMVAAAPPPAVAAINPSVPVAAGVAAAADLPPAVNSDAPGTPEELYNRAYSEMQRKEYVTATQDFKSFLLSNPNSKLAPNAQYWLGEIYYGEGNYKLASATFADGYQKAPKGVKAPDNLLKLGLSLEQQSRTKDACTVLRQLIKDYPSAPDTVTSSATKGIKRMQCSKDAA